MIPDAPRERDKAKIRAQLIRGLIRSGYKEVYTNHERAAFQRPESKHSLVMVEKNGDVYFGPVGNHLKKRKAGSNFVNELMETGEE